MSKKSVNQNTLWRNQSTTLDSDYSLNPRRSTYKKNLKAALLFVDFSKAFDSIHKGKMEQILLTCGLPKDTVTAITMLYKNTTVMVSLHYIYKDILVICRRQIGSSYENNSMRMWHTVLSGDRVSRKQTFQGFGGKISSVTLAFIRHLAINPAVSALDKGRRYFLKRKPWVDLFLFFLHHPAWMPGMCVRTHIFSQWWISKSVAWHIGTSIFPSYGLNSTTIILLQRFGVK